MSLKGRKLPVELQPRAPRCAMSPFSRFFWCFGQMCSSAGRCVVLRWSRYVSMQPARCRFPGFHESSTFAVASVPSEAKTALGSACPRREQTQAAAAACRCDWEEEEVKKTALDAEDMHSWQCQDANSSPGKRGNVEEKQVDFFPPHLSALPPSPITS